MNLPNSSWRDSEAELEQLRLENAKLKARLEECRRDRRELIKGLSRAGSAENANLGRHPGEDTTL